MHRFALFALLFVLGCATGAPPPSDDLPRWTGSEGSLRGRQGALRLQVLVLEVPARGLEGVRTGPLDVAVLDRALRAEGTRVLQSPSLSFTPERPASLFVGETVGGENVGLRLEFEGRSGGGGEGRFSLTDLRPGGEPYLAAEARFELHPDLGPQQIEIPGRRLIPLGDSTVEQERVFYVVIEAKREGD